MSCRICLEGGDSGNLMEVCDCSGSCRYVHQECLEKWMDISQNRSCEICRAVYKHNYQPKVVCDEEMSDVEEPTRGNDLACIRMVLALCALGGFLHGCTAGSDSVNVIHVNWELLFSCLLFNAYHLGIWWVFYKIKYVPEVISILWLVSFTMGLFLMCSILNVYNDAVTLVFYLNVVASSIGMFVPCCCKRMRNQTRYAQL